MHYQANRDAVLARSAESYQARKSEILSRQKDWRKNNPDQVRAKGQRYLAKHGDTQRARNRAAYRRNREAVLERQRLYAAATPEKSAAKTALRRARKRMAVPPWFSELDELTWREAADLVRLRGASTGIEWQADHMIPLAAREACGLHVASNCQVIPLTMNASKLNRLVLTKPGEWISHLHQKI